MDSEGAVKRTDAVPSCISSKETKSNALHDQPCSFDSYGCSQPYTLSSMLRVETPTDNAIIEAMNGWIKEERFLDFSFMTARDVLRLLDKYVHYCNF